jgi:hypothetical protein
VSDLLSVLAANAGVYVGRGVNHEQESFIGRMEVQPLVAGAGVMLHYIAARENGVRVHEEATLLGRCQSGTLCLWPVMEELPVVLPHEAIAVREHALDGEHIQVFASGERAARELFREEITLAVRAGGTLLYSHAWGMPGGEFGERSSCEMRRAET